MTWDKQQLAWAAGFFDGEGHVSSGGHRVKRQRQLQVSVAQTAKRRVLLSRFAESVRMGKVYGPYKGNGSSRPHYVFAVRSFEQSQALIALLWPWLSAPKRQQAREALRLMAIYHRQRKTHRGKGRVK